MLRSRNLLIVATVLTWLAAVLVLDHGIGWGPISPVEQRLVGVGTWVILLAFLAKEPVRIRAQVAVVVVFATVIEYTFSYYLHVYIYRLHNVPWYVPPGHGLVYLAALAIGRSSVVMRRPRTYIAATMVGCGAYSAWGLFISGRQDVLGALWFGCLVFFLLKARQPTVFVGAFVVVTYLELMGTHLGAWTWQTKDPILHWIAIGNPPSGAAGGYGFFDAAALALAPWIESLLAGRGERGEDVIVQEPVAAHNVAAVSTVDA